MFVDARTAQLNAAQLAALRAYFSDMLYGDSWSKRYSACRRRAFLVFGRNVHAVLARLVECSRQLHNTTLVAIPLDDEISQPPAHLGLTAGSFAAYRRFAAILNPAFAIP